MIENRAQALDALLTHYGEPYLCARKEDADSPLAATAFMHMTGDKTLFFAAAKVGISESDDFVYFYSLPVLTEELFDQCCAEALTDGLDRVDPNPNHNFSLISVFFLCDEIEKGAAAKLKKTRIHKEYAKPFAGWSDLRLAALEVTGKTRAANPLGKNLLEIYKSTVK